MDDTYIEIVAIWRRRRFRTIFRNMDGRVLHSGTLEEIIAHAHVRRIYLGKKFWF